jgi:hypothetical protein
MRFPILTGCQCHAEKLEDEKANKNLLEVKHDPLEQV